MLDKIRQAPELIKGVSITEAEKYDEILELVSCIVLPLVEDENETLVGLTSGLAPDAFYSTTAFAKLFEPTASGHGPQAWIDEDTARKAHKQIQYDLVLQKVYGRHLPNKIEMIRSFLMKKPACINIFG